MNPEYRYTPPSLRQKRQPFEKLYKGKQVMHDLVQKLSLKLESVPLNLAERNEYKIRFECTSTYKV